MGNLIDRLLMRIAPIWSAKRNQSRLAARHYEAATSGRRTSGWSRNRGDANAVLAWQATELRMHARDLTRNNSWAKRAQRVIANNTVGWGIVPKATGVEETLVDALAKRWKQWADSTECDGAGRHTFYGLQHMISKAIATDGEVLVRRRWRRPEDGLSVPMQLQVLEADYLDTTKDGEIGREGGLITQGVEFDALDRRVAYWIFPSHPGSSGQTGLSRRVPASEIIHVCYLDRPGQVRGVSWFGAAIVNIKDLDEYEDAELLKQKIAACFGAVIEDADGVTSAIAEQSEDDDLIETLEPGMVSYLKPGRKISMITPPSVAEGAFAQRNLRKIAAGLGVTYEDLTGDYSQVNFSSARMARLAHWANVRDWQFNMLVPQLCEGVWAWFIEALMTEPKSGIKGQIRADWTTPPMPMIEPDKEGLAYSRLVRNGVMTHNEMVREMGGDPATHWKEYAAGLATLDALGILLDSDVRAVSAAGLTQVRAGVGGEKHASDAADRAIEAIEITEDLPALPAGTTLTVEK